MSYRLPVFVFVAYLAVSTAPALAAYGWTAKDIAAAARALNYPRPTTKMSCRGTGSFRCVASYPHHRHRVFYAQWKGEGGWLCAGKTPSNCGLLRHGFVPNDRAAGGVTGVVAGAAAGYMGIHYNDPQPYASSPCTQTGPMAWACGYYTSNTSTVTVTITLKKLKTGYVITGSAQ